MSNESTDGTDRSLVKANGNVVSRKVVVREAVSGFNGPLGSSVVADVTDELDALLDDLEAGDVDAARGRVESILEQCDVTQQDAAADGNGGA